MEMKKLNLRPNRTTAASRKKQQGFGVMDMLIAVAILAVVVSAIYGVMFAVQSSNKAINQGKATVSLMTEIQKLYDQDYTNVSTANLATGNLALKPFTYPTATSLSHAWGGAFTAGPGDQAAATPITLFKFTFTGVPKDSCLDLVKQLSNSAYSLWVGGTTAGTNDVVAAGTSKLDQTKAITRCNAAATANIILVAQ